MRSDSRIMEASIKSPGFFLEPHTAKSVASKLGAMSYTRLISFLPIPVNHWIIVLGPQHNNNVLL